MRRHVCVACGTQNADAPQPPTRCRICEDDRQYVPRIGQQWTTHEDLLRDRTIMSGDDDGAFALSVTPSFAINQRAALVTSKDGNVLWEALSIVTDEAIAEINRRGGAQAIAISHPHFYTSMIEWSEALGGIPVLLHGADRQWVARASSRIEYWSGESLSINADLTLVNCPGHFPGSTVLHWKSGAEGLGALMLGDSVQVAMDRRQASIMHSYPNAVPVGPSVVRDVQRRLEAYEFENAYGYAWGRNIIGDAKNAIERSLARYLDAISA